MATTVQPFNGVYELDPVHSSVQFAVTHVQVSTFRGSFGDVHVRLTAEDAAPAIDAQVRVDSISIVDPAEFREHVVRSADFFDADNHPLITFRSTEVELENAGTVEIRGELTIRGIVQPVVVRGRFEAPRTDPFGTVRAGLALQATIDRRDWAMDWQLPLPDGSDAVGWDVEVTAHLELVEQR